VSGEEAWLRSLHFSPEVEEEAIASAFHRKSHAGFCSPAHISAYVVFVTATAREIRQTGVRRGLPIAASRSGAGAARLVRESTQTASAFGEEPRTAPARQAARFCGRKRKRELGCTTRLMSRLTDKGSRNPPPSPDGSAPLLPAHSLPLCFPHPQITSPAGTSANGASAVLWS